MKQFIINNHVKMIAILIVSLQLFTISWFIKEVININDWKYLYNLILAIIYIIYIIKIITYNKTILCSKRQRRN
jgi:membrane protein DedA with SNARE-associated domain